MDKSMLYFQANASPCGDVMNRIGASQIAKEQTSFSSLTMFDIPFFTTQYLFSACSAYDT